MPLSGGNDEGLLLLPPLPGHILDVFSRTAFCYLATVEEVTGSPSTAVAHYSPHLCLMRFVWVSDPLHEGGGSLVLSTRRDSRKFFALQRNPHVAVLVHDDSALLSVTVYGDAEVCDGDEAERLRALHLARNPEYAQFISDRQRIAVVRIRVRTCRTADVNDRVHDIGPNAPSVRAAADTAV